jgi:hypothetical protein
MGKIFISTRNLLLIILQTYLDKCSGISNANCTSDVYINSSNIELNTYDHHAQVLVFVQPSDLDQTRKLVQSWKEKCGSCHFYTKTLIITSVDVDDDDDSSKRLPSVHYSVLHTTYRVYCKEICAN